MEQLAQLPKTFVIKRDASNPLWDEYINWLNENYKDELVGRQDYYYGVFDGESDFKSEWYIVEADVVILTLEQWYAIIKGGKVDIDEEDEQIKLLEESLWNENTGAPTNSYKQGNAPENELQGKLKLKVDILGSGKLLGELVQMVGNHNSGKVPINLNLIEAYLQAEIDHYKRTLGGASFKKGEDGELLISDDGGNTHYLVIKEELHYPLVDYSDMLGNDGSKELMENHSI